MGETMGLSKAEKKALYVPGGPWGRKLLPNEQPYSPMVTKGFVKKDFAIGTEISTETTFMSSKDPSFIE